MRLRFTRDAFLGARSYSPGDVAEVADAVAHRHVKAGSAVPAPEACEADPDDVEVETAAAPPHAETADARPGARRKAR